MMRGVRISYCGIGRSDEYILLSLLEITISSLYELVYETDEFTMKKELEKKDAVEEWRHFFGFTLRTAMLSK